MKYQKINNFNQPISKRNNQNLIKKYQVGEKVEILANLYLTIPQGSMATVDRISNSRVYVRGSGLHTLSFLPSQIRKVYYEV